MEAFAIIGFIFGLSAFARATANAAHLKKLEKELEELRGGQESGDAE